MKIGIINNPFKDVLDEIKWAGENNFDVFELTLEPLNSTPEIISKIDVKKELDKYSLELIGHTCYYLPYASPIKRLKEAAVSELKEYIDTFALLGAKKMNIHLDDNYSSLFIEHKKIDILLNNHIESLKELVKYAETKNVKLMLENSPKGLLIKPEDLRPIFSAVPDVGLHLDVGHANVAGHKYISEFIQQYSDIIEHVHFSDNNGDKDSHLPLGSGKIKWNEVVALLKQYKYNNFITLEVFSNDNNYKIYSKDLVRKLWDTL